MQLYALNSDREIVNAAWAQQGKDYLCAECGNILRVRGGPRMQRHYYHYRGTALCRQAGKSEVHLMVQRKILSALPIGEGKMERRFAEIGRIADVVWENKKVVFEVQCASMKPEEALSRIKDYNSIGWEVIWILHDSRYNQKLRSPLEEALEEFTHYFTDIDRFGRGVIYDRLAVWREYWQFAVSPRRTVVFEMQEVQKSMKGPSILENRHRYWSMHLAGDYLMLWEEDPCLSFWREAYKLGLRNSRNHWVYIILGKILRVYKLLFQIVLERASR